MSRNQVTISLRLGVRNRPDRGKMAKPLTLPQTSLKVAIAVVAHADDALLFAGGLLIHLVKNGWQLHIVRVTDDRWDSWGLTEEETISRNRKEFQAAMKAIGVSSIVELNYPTDLLGDRSEVELRKEIISIFRSVKPYLVISFDPDSYLYEDNEDHKLVARAVSEASWSAGFDKHPGMQSETTVHLPIERWFFGRRVSEVTHTLNTYEYVDQLVSAIAKHKTMLENMAHQLNIQARVIGYSLDRLLHLAESSPEDFARMVISNRDHEEFRIIGAEKLMKAIEKYGDPI